MSINPEILTPRLRLEAQCAMHAALVFEPLQAPELYTFIGSPPPLSLEALTTRFKQLESRRSPDDRAYWLNWILVERDQGRVVGKIDATLDADGLVEFGYIVFVPGQGYATEAARAVLRHLCSAGARWIRTTVTVGNHASRRVMEKLGMPLRRILPDNDMIRGQSMDDWEFLLDAPSYLAAQAQRAMLKGE